MTYKNAIKNNSNKKAIAFIIAGILFIFVFTSITGGQRTYEVRPEIELPDYRTDNAHLIEAYERLMDRYMDLVEKNLGTIDLDIKNTAQALVSINKKLDELSARTARIEKALGIEEPQRPINKSQITKEPDSKEIKSEGQQ
ncbi:MAG: hypothetical protein P8016_10550 [Sedimentisphaerales bacterium]